MLKSGLKSKSRTKRRFFRKMSKALSKGKTSIPNRVHMFKRMGQISRITVTGVGAIGNSGFDGNGSQFLTGVTADSMANNYQFGASYVFKLSSVIDSGDFTQLYDKYKITGIKVRIMWQCNQAGVSGTAVLPILSYSVDHDDAALPSSLYQITTKGTSKVKVLGQRNYVDVYIRPKVAGALYQSLLTGYSSVKAPFINSTYPDVQHYGLKFWLNNVYMAAGINNQFEIQPTYYIACKESQ